MKKLFLSLTSFVLAVGIVSIVAVSLPVAAQDALEQGIQAAHGDGIPTTITGDGGVITTVINVMLYIVGILSVIMLIYGGIRYTISGGNSSAVTAAKNTILYAIVGLVIAIFAYAAINFIFQAATGGVGIGSGGTDV